MSYQFIAISICDKRKEILKKQFVDLDIKAPLYFIENPSLISNSQYYLPKYEMDNESLKVICCSRDHIRALEYACKDESPEFSIILEDDVAFHKTQFINGIEEIIANWETCISPKKMVSLGWVPCNHYESYLSGYSKYTLKCVLGSKLLLDRFVPGTQAYMVRKKDVSQIIKELIHPTFDEFKTHVNSLNFNHLSKNNELIAIDCYINRILGQVVVYPPLAIEQETVSLIGHNNTQCYWNTFFKDYECIKKNYYTF
jgi:hypothetical protein